MRRRGIAGRHTLLTDFGYDPARVKTERYGPTGG